MSMTGFGRASAETESKKITVELKSLNSKQFDFNTRIPYSFREQELAIRSYVAGILERGKADLTATVEHIGNDLPASSRVNVEILRQYKAQICEAASELGIPEPTDWYSVLLRFPDSIHTETPESAEESDVEALMAAVRGAVEALMAHRREEGIELEKFFMKRIETISDLLKSIEPYEQERVPRIRARIEEGLARIPVIEYDKGRLEQEMIFYIEKLDVNEEKQRLAKHLDYFIETMNSPEPGQGKKLGFIAQEMGREINTLGSKSNHAEMQATVVRMKDALEQIKEQVLNVM